MILFDDHVPVRVPGCAVEDIYPALANPISITPGTPLGTFSGYTTIGTLGGSDEGVPSHWIIQADPATALNKGIIEARFGGATTFAYAYIQPTNTDPGADDAGSFERSRFMYPYRLPAGTTIDARATSSAADPFEMYMALWKGNDVPVAHHWPRLRDYFNGAIFGVPTLSTVFTGGGTNVIAAGGAAWSGYGSWAVPFASANAGLITEIWINPTAANTARHYQVEIGIGASTAEVALFRTAVIRTGTQHAIYPPILVEQGDRVAARCASSVAGATVGVYLNLYPFA